MIQLDNKLNANEAKNLRPSISSLKESNLTEPQLAQPDSENLNPQASQETSIQLHQAEPKIEDKKSDNDIQKGFEKFNFGVNCAGVLANCSTAFLQLFFKNNNNDSLVFEPLISYDL